MSPDKLVYMANQIGKFFMSQGADKAEAGIAEHLQKFWTPACASPFSSTWIEAAPD